MTDPNGIQLAYSILSTASALVEEIHTRLHAMGFDDTRPAHGFAFARIAPDGATVTEVAEHLGVTKQAASQLLDELVRKGYVARTKHPRDARARLMVLTERGRAATRAADQATADVVAQWSAQLGGDRIAALTADLSRIAKPGRLRPVW